MADIRCAHCKGYHPTVHDVRECSQGVNGNPFVITATSVERRYPSPANSNKLVAADFFSLVEWNRTHPEAAVSMARAETITEQVVRHVNGHQDKILAERLDVAYPEDAPALAERSTEPIDVPAGRYAVAVEGDKNDLSFFRVADGKGKWEGRKFLTQYASDTEYDVKGKRATAVLLLISKDIEGAARLFGQEIGKCCRCGRSLTDEASRAAGIGPECAGKVNW